MQIICKGSLRWSPQSNTLKERKMASEKLVVTENPRVREVAERLHYIDYFYEQRDVPDDWSLLLQAQHNKYLNYAVQLLKVWEQT